MSTVLLTAGRDQTLSSSIEVDTNEILQLTIFCPTANIPKDIPHFKVKRKNYLDIYESFSVASVGAVVMNGSVYSITIPYPGEYKVFRPDITDFDIDIGVEYNKFPSLIGPEGETGPAGPGGGYLFQVGGSNSATHYHWAYLPFDQAQILIEATDPTVDVGDPSQPSYEITSSEGGDYQTHTHTMDIFYDYNNKIFICENVSDNFSDIPHSGFMIGGNEFRGRNNIASGEYSTVSGGNTNLASGDNSAIGGGTYNTASGESSTVSGGIENTASGLYSSIGGGYGNIAGDEYAVVSGGSENNASGLYSSIGGGEGNTASGIASTVSGGKNNSASGDNSWIPGGSNCL